MPIDKKVPRFLNLDDDVRYLNENEMSDASNVRAFSSETNNAGALEIVQGNVEITNPNLPSGENKIIGASFLKNTNDIFFALWNENDKHGIYRYNDITGSLQLILQKSFLNFIKNSFVDMRAYQARGAFEVLLYFTDNINPPRKLNVNKALNGDYSSFFTNVKEEFVTLAKKAPTKGPTWTYRNDPDFLGNNINRKTYQFRYRYIYDDGEESVFSVASSLAADESQLTGLKAQNSELNTIDITLKSGSRIVDEIEVIARRGNEGAWFIIDRFKNKAALQNQTISFNDTGAYSAVSEIDANQLLSNVPLNAATLDIVESRLVLGDYTDGYNLNEDIKKAGQDDITIKPFGLEVDATKTNFASVNSFISNTATKSIVANIDMSNFTNLSKGSIISLNIKGVVVGSLSQIFTLPFIWNIDESHTFVANSGDSIADAVNSFITAFNKKVIASSGTPVIEIQASNRLNPNILNLIFRFKTSENSNSFFSPDSITNGLSFLGGSILGLETGSSFKKEGSYQLGIIEYDEYMRPSTVNTFDNNSVDIPSLSDISAKVKEEKGRVFLDYRIDPAIKPQERTRFWQWAITENRNQDEFIQYAVMAAESPLGDDTIYLNLTNLTGDDKSYDISQGANIFTQIQRGDIVNVLKYYDKSESERIIVGGSIKTEVVSAELYDAASSPTGSEGFLVGVKNVEIGNWSHTKVKNNDSNWQPDVASNVESKPLIEIYRPKNNTLEEDTVYYEIGGINEVINAGLTNRYFKGNLRDANQSITYDVETQTSSFLGIDENSVDFVVGDIIELLDSSSNSLGFREIEDIVPFNSNVRIYISNIPSSVDNISLASNHSSGQIKDGDVWYKIRDISLSQTILENNIPIEDRRVSDFYNSKAWSKGRANAYDPNAKEIRRFSSLTISDTYFSETNYNGFSNFNLALANFIQLPQQYGAVKRVALRDESLIVFQENKIGRVPVGRNIIENANGNQSLILSDKLFGKVDYYKTDYGLTKSQSLAEYDGDFFGWDLKRGKVWGLYYNGIQLLSDTKVSSLFDEKSEEILLFATNIDVVLGIDRENEELIVSCPNATAKTIGSPGLDDTPQKFPGIVDDGGGNLIMPVQPVLSDKINKVTHSNESRPINTIGEVHSKWGGTKVSANDIINVGVFPVSKSQIINGSEIDISTNINIGGQLREVKGKVNISKGTISFPKSQPAAATPDLTIGGTTQEFKGFSISYSFAGKRWSSFLDFKPEMYVNINYNFYSFKNGLLYKHNDPASFANFYDVQYYPYFEVCFNLEPSKVKRFLSFSMEGNNPYWDVDFQSNLVSGLLPYNLWETKEGLFHSKAPRGITGSGVTSIVGLGEVSAVSASGGLVSLVIGGLDAGAMGIFVGEALYDSDDNLLGEITSLEGSTIEIDNQIVPNVGDYVLVKKFAPLEGDELRGYYLKGKYQLNNSDPSFAEQFQEVFAVNTKYIESKLHNT
mgnify:CR=1 FL=1